MRIEYDPEADAAYLYVRYPIKDGESKKTVEVSEDIAIDFDAEGRLLGVEVLNARKLLDKKILLEAQSIAH